MKETMSKLLVVFVCGLPGFGCADSPWPLFALVEMAARERGTSAPYSIVGEDDSGRSYLAIESGPAITSDADAAPTTTVFALDLASLHAVVVASDVEALPRDVRASGPYVAWPNPDKTGVVVRRLDTRDEEEITVGTQSGMAYEELIDLDDGRLVLQARGPATNRDFGASFAFVIHELPSGTEWYVDDVWGYGTFAILGDYVAVMHEGDGSVEAVGLELHAGIDVVDLRSGDRATVARNIPVDGNGGELMTSDGRFIWQQFKSSVVKSKVRSYDPETGNVRTLAETLDGDASEAWLVDVHDERMLVDKEYGERLLGQSSRYELRSFDGASTEVVTFANARLRPRTFRPDPCFAGRYVVWTDPYEGDLVIFDPETGGTRRFDPRDLIIGHTNDDSESLSATP